MIGQIRIDHTWPRLGIERQRGEGLNLQSLPARMEIKQPAAILDIQQAHPKVTVDANDAWADLGLAGNVDFMAQNQQLSRQAALDGIGRTATNGDRMAREPKAITKIAVEAFPPEHEFNVGMVPRDRPGIEVVGETKPQIEVTAQPPKISFQKNDPVVRYEPDAMKIYVEQKQQLAIRYEPRMDTRV